MTQIPVISYDELFTSKDNECYLGEGSFGLVYRCYHRTIGDVAVKILNSATSKPVQSFNREGVMHLSANRCEHILTLHGIAQKDNFVGLVLEYMPYGSLSGLVLEENFELPWRFRLRALSEIASGIHYLHHLPYGRRLVHCDIKLENILVNGDLHAKIGDFGGANLSTYTGHTMTTTSRGAKGVECDEKKLQYTLSYAAPELLNCIDIDRTPAMDVYSMAIVMYVITVRRNAFDTLEKEVIIHAVKTGQRPQKYIKDVEADLREDGDDVGLQIFSLLDHLRPQCWHQEPLQRMQIENIRDSLMNKLNSFSLESVERDLSTVKGQLQRGNLAAPSERMPIVHKYKELLQGGKLVVPNSSRTGTKNMSKSRAFVQNSQRAPDTLQSNVPQGLERQPQSGAPPPPFRDGASGSSRSQSTSDMRPTQPPPPPSRSYSVHDTSLTKPHIIQPSQPPPCTTLPAEISQVSISPSPRQQGVIELEASFRDPYLRQGNAVTMITDLAAVKNAQVGHGGWHDKLLSVRDAQGIVRSVEANGDVTVTFSGVESHRFNQISLTKLPSSTDLSVGDFVKIDLEKDIVSAMQEGHGGWVDDMYKFFNEPGLVFRFLSEGDVLVVYKTGKYFRYNPEVLVKINKTPDDVQLTDNPNINIGDYVYYDMDRDLLKELQEHCGGWNDAMADLQGKAGKFVYADYHGRAFIAYSSKQCFVFNAAVMNKISTEEAVRRFKQSKEEANKVAKEKTEKQVRNYRFAVGDKVRVCLPLDIVVELQKGNGGWCYQMLEVYGISGVVKEFDEGRNAQVLFDTGNKWTFNPASLERLPLDGNAAPPDYTPPFKIGDQVKVSLEQLNNASLNQMRIAFRQLEIPEDKVEILMKTGTVLGIDDDIDVIVSFGDEKNYGLKPEQLQKI